MNGPSSYARSESLLERLSGQTEVSFGSPYQTGRGYRRDSRPISTQESPPRHLPAVLGINGIDAEVESTADFHLPNAPAPTTSTDPYEMDAVENEYNPWSHTPMPIVGQVPHRWEKMVGTDRMFFDAEQHVSRHPIEWNWDSFLNETPPQIQSRAQESVFEPVSFMEFCKRTTSHDPYVEIVDGHEDNVFGVLDRSECTYNSSDRSGLMEPNGELRSAIDVQRWASEYH
jgi:hypothetical protein